MGLSQQRQAGALPSGLGDDVDGALGLLGHCDKDLNHRAHWKGLTFAEAYNRGRFEICFLFASAGASRRPPRLAAPLRAGRDDVELDAIGHDKGNVLPALQGHFGHGLGEVGRGEASATNGGDDELMLVGHIKGVDSVQCLVSARIRFEAVNLLDDLFSGAMYLSCLNGATKTLRRFTEGELDVLALSGCFAFVANHLVDEQIECGSQVVNGVADDQGDFGWHGYLGFDPVGNLAGLAVKATENSQGMLGRVGINHPVEFNDVLLGPFDL